LIFIVAAPPRSGGRRRRCGPSDRFKKDNPQSPVLKAGNPRPPPNPSIRLDFLGIGMLDHILDPLILDKCPVNPMACVPEVIGLRKK
jgi:hypothetical protein